MPRRRRVGVGSPCSLVLEAGGLAASCRRLRILSGMRLEGNAGLLFAFLTSSSCPRLREAKASHPRLTCRSLCHLAPSRWWPKGAEVLHKHSPPRTRCSHLGCGQQRCESNLCESNSSAPGSAQLGHHPQALLEHLGGAAVQHLAALAPALRGWEMARAWGSLSVVPWPCWSSPRNKASALQVHQC